MKYCPNPNCPFLSEVEQVAEFEDQVTHCRDCGSELVSGNAPSPEELLRLRTLNELKELELVATFASLEDAEACQARLDIAGIPSVVEETDPTSSSSAPVAGEESWEARLFVQHEHLASAFRILELMDEEEDDEWQGEDELEGVESELDDEEFEDELIPAEPWILTTPYPALSEWIATSGWIEIGYNDDPEASTVRVRDVEGAIWQSNQEFATLDELLATANRAIEEWLEAEQAESAE